MAVVESRIVAFHAVCIVRSVWVNTFLFGVWIQNTAEHKLFLVASFGLLLFFYRELDETDAVDIVSHAICVINWSL